MDKYSCNYLILFGIPVKIAASLMLALDSFCAITSCVTSSRDENSCLTCAQGTVLQHLALSTRNPRVLPLSGHPPRVASRIEPMSGNPCHIFHWMLETVGVTVDILYTSHSPVKGWWSNLFTNHHRFWSNKHLSDMLVVLNSNDVSPQTTLYVFLVTFDKSGAGPICPATADSFVVTIR